jgi:hypothetical protein
MSAIDAAFNLKLLKGVDQMQVDRNPPREFAQVWDELLTNIRVENNNTKANVLSADAALRKLTNPFTNVYQSEEEFDMA